MPTLSELQIKILAEEFPHLSLEHDPDVERYFDLRHAGRQADALYLYNTKIVRKYPDPKRRALLMQSFRSRDPLFIEILQENLSQLSNRLLERTEFIIIRLSRDIDSVKMSDAYAVIRLVEGLLAIISSDRYAAIGFSEKYARYARLLGIRQEEMERTAELIRLYVTETLDSVQDLKKEKEDRQKRNMRKRIEGRKRQPSFDLSRVEFSKEDIARIRIPSSITRVEDQVIAYALKYWNLTSDPAFERAVVLYSRKHHTRHGDIFAAIKTGKDHGWKDEEILNAVLSNVVSGYYYSISGDAYLQRVWAHYRQALPVVAPVISMQDGAPTQKIKKPKSYASRKPKRVIPHTQKKKEIHIPRASVIRKDQQKIVSNITANSISDMIRKLTGKTYTVYKELFFKNIRPAIRIVLASSTDKKGSIFNNTQNDAEELIYGFLFTHYNNPYQNWTKSPEYNQIEKMGYSIPEIEPIIDSWVKSSRSK